MKRGVAAEDRLIDVFSNPVNIFYSSYIIIYGLSH